MSDSKDPEPSGEAHQEGATIKPVTVLLTIIIILLVGVIILLFTRLPPGPTKPVSAEAGQATCRINLKILDGAMDLWALERNKSDYESPTESELIPYIVGGWPHCPSGGHYVLGLLGSNPRCSIQSHSLQ